MNIKAFLLIASTTGLLLGSCGNSNNEKTDKTTEVATEPGGESAAASTATDEEKGIGKFTNVELTHPLDPDMVKKGESIYDVKCSSCHKLSDERIVGPGWKGITDRRTPEWIMNFVTNTEEMLDKDPNAQAMLEVCMVRMPNQNLTDQEARDVLEFMRKNDGKN